LWKSVSGRWLRAALARPASSAHSTAHVIPSLQRASGDAVRKRIMAHRSGLQSVALAGCQGDRSLQQFSAANHSPRPPEFHAQ